MQVSTDEKTYCISLLFLILFTTITKQHKTIISRFNVENIYIENNVLLEDEEIKKLLASFYNKNLIFLNYKEIEKINAK